MYLFSYLFKVSLKSGIVLLSPQKGVYYVLILLHALLDFLSTISFVHSAEKNKLTINWANANNVISHAFCLCSHERIPSKITTFISEMLQLLSK